MIYFGNMEEYIPKTTKNCPRQKRSTKMVLILWRYYYVNFCLPTIVFFFLTENSLLPLNKLSINYILQQNKKKQFKYLVYLVLSFLELGLLLFIPIINELWSLWKDIQHLSCYYSFFYVFYSYSSAVQFSH